MEDGVEPETSEAETSEDDACLLRAGAALWKAVIREGSPPAEDTGAALQAIRASLDAARRLRFAGGVSEDERRRLAVLAAEAAEKQECALWLWYAGRIDMAAHAAVAPGLVRPIRPFLQRARRE